MIYLDNAATTKTSPAAQKAMLECMEQFWGNPSSLHTPGQKAAEALAQARETVAACIGAAPREIYFTSGGSEADNQAIRSAAYGGRKAGKNHLIASAIEHHAVLHTLEALEQEGFSVTLLPVGEDGIVRPETVAAALRPETALVSVMFANNEVGTIQPVAELGALCRARGVVFHTDGVQAAGHLPIDVAAQSIDMLALSGHKFHGPQGVGALYVRRGVPLEPFVLGGAQERGKRAGTENLPAIAGMAAALEAACGTMEADAVRMTALRDRLTERLLAIPGCALNGDRARRLPGNVNVSFCGVEGETLLLLLDQRGIAVSTGSACASGSLEPSHVLLALGKSREQAQGSIRLTLGEDTTAEDIHRAAEAVAECVARLRSFGDVSGENGGKSSAGRM